MYIALAFLCGALISGLCVYIFYLKKDSAQDLYYQLPIVYFKIDEKGVILEKSKYVNKAIGCNCKVGDNFYTQFVKQGFDVSDIKDAVKNSEYQVVPKQNIMNRWMRISIYPLRKQSVNYALIQLEDIDDQVRMEELIIESEKMITIGGLASGMAHEINNPLAGILQAVQVIQQRIRNDVWGNRNAAEKFDVDFEQLHNYLEDRKVFALLDNIEYAGHRAANVIRNLLSFSDKKPERYETVDCEEVVKEAVFLLENDFDFLLDYDFKKIEIELHQKEKLEVFAVRNSLVQGIMNILRNAAIAITESKIKNGMITISLLKDEKNVIIKIADNGPGIKQEHLPHVFEPFFTTRKVGQGAGLGLSVAYFIFVEQHGGRISMRSPKGAEVEVVLPLQETL